MQEIDAVAKLAALAQPMRLRVFRELVTAGAAGLTPGVLAERLAVPAATLSFHLKELLHAGLATQERASRHLIYRADFTQMNDLLGFLTENCCQGESCGVSAAPCKPARPAAARPAASSTHRTRVATPRR
ncbi:ArsR/SmtB family transcription factor [Ramlibacter sp.]|uniref:ArsR/SmtB family transcription factor n=1 Tax=Ramlibacter sp. TaxID=1917967 RepID=UPI0035B4D1E9